MLRPSLAAVAAVLLVGCVSSPLPEGSYAARGGLGPVAERIADRIGDCWFADGEVAFDGLRQETEITSLSGQPRILLVKSGERGGLPQLAVTIRRTDAGTVVSSFGPLTNTPLKARINADIARWAAGGNAC